MAGTRTEWPPEKVQRLREMVAAGNMSMVMIAVTLGVSERAVRAKMQSLGFLKRASQWNPKRTARAIELWKQGFSAGHIAADLGNGITRNAVIGRLNRLGFKRDSIDPSWRRRAGALANEKRKAQKAKTEKREGKFLKKPTILSKLLELPLPADDPDDVATTTVIDREPHQCAWVIGRPQDQKMCGAPIVPNLPSPFCLKHARRSYRLPEPRPFVVQSTAEALRRKRLREAGLLDEFVEPVKESA